MKFCEKLVTLRKNKKMSQEQLADMLDVSRQAVSKWESGQAYPEMDKLLSICKIFKCDLNDLTNDEVKEIASPKRKDSILNFIDDLLEMFNKSITMFSRMSFKQITTFIIEMLVVIAVLVLVSVPFGYLYRLPYNIFPTFDNPFLELLCNLWYAVTNLVYIIFCIVTVTYIYKRRFLDKFVEEEKPVLAEENTKEDTAEFKEKPQNEKKLRERKEYNSSSVLSFFNNIFIVFLKIMAFLIALPFAVGVVSVSIFLAIAVILICQGVFYFGPLLISIFALIACSVIVELLVKFLFNQKSNFKRIFLTLLISMIGLGVAVGITGVEMTTIKFNNEIPAHISKVTKEKEYPMTDKTIIDSRYFARTIKYVIDETLKDTFKVAVNYYDKYGKLDITYYNDFLMIDHNQQNINIFKEVIDSLKKREVYNYSDLFEIDVTVRISSKNLEQIKKRNQENIENEMNNMCRDLEVRYNELETKYYNLEEKYNREIEEYRFKLEQYKDALKNLDI